MSLRRINASILSPLLAFPLAWGFTALLAQAQLLNTQGPWSSLMIEAVVAVPLAFFFGGLIGEGIAVATTRFSASRSEVTISDRAFRRALVVLLAIGLLELLHQFAKARAIPLFSGSIDAARFGQGGPTIILTDLLTVAAIAGLTRPRELFARESRFELLAAAVALGAFGLQAGRGSVVLPIIVAILARWLYWERPSIYIILAGGMIAFLAICFGFYLRVYQHPTTPFEAELFSEVLPGMPFFLKPLIPVYIALTTNFIALQGVVGHYPTVAEYGHGVYDAVALKDFIPGTENISGVSATLTPPWVTSTVAGSFWAGGGFAVLIPGVAVTGALAAGAFAAARRTISLRWSMVAAYLLFTSLFGLYTNSWTQHLDWLVVTPCLLILGAFAENPRHPPGAIGAIWGRLRRMSGRPIQPEPDRQPDQGVGISRWKRLRGPLLAGSLALAVLLGAGVVVQATLPEPYPLVSTQRLPESVATARALMTEGDRLSDNSPLWWLNLEGEDASLHAFTPAGPDEGARLVSNFRMRVPPDAQFDIGAWPPLRNGAFFTMQPTGGDKLLTTIRRPEDGSVFTRLISKVGPPAPGSTRDYSIATFSGRKADLIVIDRNVKDTRVSVRVLSGESNFKTQVFATSLPFGGTAPPEWSLDVGAIASRAPSDLSLEPIRPAADIIFVQRNGDRDHAGLKVALGEDGFQGFSFQRDLDAPGDGPEDTRFLIGSEGGATVIYEVSPSSEGGPLLRAYAIQPPIGLL
jgi:hypothetical protein